MRLGEFFSRLDRLAEFYYTINDQMRRVAEDVKRLDAALAKVQEDLSTLKADVAALQEARQTLRAELRAVIAETVADLRVRYAEAEARRTASEGQPREGESPALPPSAE